MLLLPPPLISLSLPRSFSYFVSFSLSIALTLAATLRKLCSNMAEVLDGRSNSRKSISSCSTLFHPANIYCSYS